MFGGWLYPVLISLGVIVVFTAMELLSIVISDKAAARKPAGRVSGVGRQKAA